MSEVSKSPIYEEKEDRNEVIEYFVSALKEQQEDLNRVPGQNVITDNEAEEQAICLENLSSEMLLAIEQMDKEELDILKKGLQNFIAESERLIEKNAVSALADVFTLIGAKEMELADQIEIDGRLFADGDKRVLERVRAYCLKLRSLMSE